MSELERLIRFVHDAPAGTMVPVESLRELLADAPVADKKEERRLTPAEAADWLHRHLGGRKRSAAAVRKVMRTGFRGVVLKSYPYGRERRTTEADLRRFVVQIGAIPLPPTPAAAPVTVMASAPAGGGFATKAHADPADEVAAAQERFGRRRTTAPARPPGQRRASGGA
ncbi:MAG TPA: hypothetical protein VFT45_28030 [Longimicrobium sp.]|nr:hypothetical protein [Longimicrobium sp.]